MLEKDDGADSVTRILNSLRQGDPCAGNELLGAVYTHLRKMAAAKMSAERPGQTIQGTALVHEAWLRLGDAGFENRAHFFGAAAEAMRRILVERARRRHRIKHGGGVDNLNIDDVEIAGPEPNGDLLAVHEALDRLAEVDSRKAELVKLRYFVGLSFEECAALLGVSVPTAKRDWNYARAWLHQVISRG